MQSHSNRVTTELRKIKRSIVFSALMLVHIGFSFLFCIPHQLIYIPLRPVVASNRLEPIHNPIMSITVLFSRDTNERIKKLQFKSEGSIFHLNKGHDFIYISGFSKDSTQLGILNP